MSSIFKKIFKNEFIKNTSVLVAGTVFAQAIALLSSILLTRLYSPSDFGKLGVFTSITSFLTILAGLRFEVAIVPAKRNEGFKLLHLSLYIIVLLSFICFLIIFILRCFLEVSFFGLNDYVYFVPFSVLFAGSFQSLNYWNTKKKNFKLLSKRKILQSFGTSLSSVISGLIDSMKSVGLIFGQMFGHFISAAYLLLTTIKKEDFFLTISLKTVARIFIKYKQFSATNSISAIFNSLASHSPILLLSYLYGNTSLGFYTLVLKVLSVPMTIVGTSVSQVFFQKSNENMEKETDLNSLFRKVSTVLFLIVIIPMLLLFIFGEILFAFAFGEEWETSGTIASILSPYFLIRFIVSSQATLLISLNRLNVDLLYNIVLFLIQVLSFLIAFHYSSSILLAYKWIAILGFLLFTALWVYLDLITKKKDSNTPSIRSLHS